MTLNLVPTKRYTNAKYEGPNSYQSKDIANVKAFADKQADEWTGKKLYAPDLSRQEDKNVNKSDTCNTE